MAVEVHPVVFDRVALGVDEAGARVADNHARLAVEHLHAALDEGRSADIVVVRPFEVFAVAKADYFTLAVGGSEIGVTAVEADALVTFGVNAANFRRPVGGAVVQEDNIEVCKSLVDNRFKGLFKIIGAVVNWNADGNSGMRR